MMYMPFLILKLVLAFNRKVNRLNLNFWRRGMVGVRRKVLQDQMAHTYKALQERNLLPHGNLISNFFDDKH